MNGWNGYNLSIGDLLIEWSVIEMLVEVTYSLFHYLEMTSPYYLKQLSNGAMPKSLSLINLSLQTATLGRVDWWALVLWTRLNYTTIT